MGIYPLCPLRRMAAGWKYSLQAGKNNTLQISYINSRRMVRGINADQPQKSGAAATDGVSLCTGE